MHNRADKSIMRLFETPDPERRSVALDLRKVSGIVQQEDYTILVHLGEHSILIADQFDRVWELVDQAKKREEAL